MPIPRPETSQAPSPRPERSKKRPKKVPTLNELAETTKKVADSLWKSLTGFVTKLSTKDSKGLMPALTGILALFTKGFQNLPGKLSKKIEEGKERRENKKRKKAEKEKMGKKLKKIKTNVKLNELMGKIKPEQKRFDHTKIKSHPFQRGRSSKKYPKGITLCSLTAKKNLEMLCPGKIYRSIRSKPHTKADIQKVREDAAAGKFDIKDVMPTGNADDVQQFYLALRKPDMITGNLPKDYIEQLNETNKTVCDILTFGSTKYDHRAAGFKGIDGNWYVLDPYKRGGSTAPMLFEDYIVKNKIDIGFVVPINTSRKHRIEVSV